MYQGPMDKAKREAGSRVGGGDGWGGGKMETTVLEQQYKKEKKKTGKRCRIICCL